MTELSAPPTPPSQELSGPVNPGLVLPQGTPAEMKAAMQLYQATCDAILEASDYQQTDGRSFKKKSAWAKLAIAFGVSSEIISHHTEYDDHDRVIAAEFVVRATAPNGRYADGWGQCSVSESRFTYAKGRQKLAHDLPATAETRARNRAYAALFGHGEVSAEEVNSQPPRRSSVGTIPRADEAEVDALIQEVTRTMGPEEKLTILNASGITQSDVRRGDRWLHELATQKLNDLREQLLDRAYAESTAESATAASISEDRTGDDDLGY